MKTPASILALICVGAIASCFPKAIPVATDRVKEGGQGNRSGAAMVNSDLPAADSSIHGGMNAAAGLRRPDMLTLPDDRDLRGTKPSENTQPGGAVNVRPPTEPPSRPKPPGE